MRWTHINCTRFDKCIAHNLEYNQPSILEALWDGQLFPLLCRASSPNPVASSCPSPRALALKWLRRPDQHL